MGAQDAGDDLGLERFQTPADDEGLSLEELSTAYAELLNRGACPYEEDLPVAAGESEESLAEDGAENWPDLPADDGCDLSPKSILEAMLFVGDSHNRPLTSRRVASLMRGVRPQEIDELVLELNAEYAHEGRPYTIASVDAGYVMQLSAELHGLRDVYYGRVREARLSQPAIDVLAIVAYRQPIARQQLDEIRGKPSGSILTQLVRRGLVHLDRADGSSRATHYRTTDRFLQLFGMASLAELPQGQEGMPGDDG
ncbi:MAG: SMC-Scp complex subunit ScpB [Pirellulaceae bacterium]